MRRLAGTSLVALATAILLGALSLVAWRQARALEALERLDEINREWGLGSAEKEELQRRIRFLESRGRVVPEAVERIDMKKPQAAEIVILSGEVQ